MDTPAISTTNLTRRFGDFVAVDSINLRVTPGQFFGFLGPNGAGKSTTIKMLTGLLAPSAGRMEILGLDLASHSLEVKQHIGVVPEGMALFGRLTGPEYLNFAGRMYGLNRETAAKRTTELLEFMQLDREPGKLITDYSHGMQKKLALAAAVIHGPKILFLDEPFEGVDAIAAGTLIAMLQRMITRGARFARRAARGHRSAPRRGCFFRRKTNSRTNLSRYRWRLARRRKRAHLAELSIPGVSQQIQLIARLRWMLFKNSLRNIKGRLEALSSAILWLMMSGLVLGGGIFFGIATYYLVQHNHWGWLAGLLWIVFVFWQVYPIFAASAGAQFDFANLLRFPLRFSSFFILSLVYGLFDPGAVSSIAWLFAMWIGLVLARPSLFLWGLVVLVAFGALNLFFSRMIFAWVEKWLARRRTREVLGFIFVLGILSIQLINPAIQHFHRSHTHLSGGWLMRLLPVANALPAGVAGTALQSALTGAFVPAAYSLLFVLLYAGVFLWLLRIRLAAQFHGENLSEARAPSVVAP